MADIYIMADVLRHIYITADKLWQTYCVQQRWRCLDKFTAQETLDCCIRIPSLQRIAPWTPLTVLFIKHAKVNKMPSGPTHGGGAIHLTAQNLSLAHIYIYMRYRWMNIYEI